jgi:Ni/Fe-hydrogenase subunit HybB-like protein
MNMGMRTTNGRRRPEMSFWRLVLLTLAAAGAVATALRFTRGLGATTNLSDQFPWGLWIGFDVLCGVGLAAGGFTITAAVYIFNLKRFTPIIRPTVLTAFLGYLFVIFALMFDLGQPHRIWHALVMWNPRSVMFEVAWCVMLYTTVLSLEFSPIVFERLNLERPRRIVRAISVPLVIVGVILSTLHQSSLGSLYLIVPEKLHPLWYSPLLPVFFFTSAIAAGLAMVIVESYLCQRAFDHHLEMDLLEPLGRAMVVVLSMYGILRLQDLARRGALAGLRRPDYEGTMFLLEMGLGVLLPILLLAIPRIRGTQPGLVTGAFLAVLGFVMHRMNVSVTGMERASGVSYFPSWMEFAVSLALVAGGFAIFGLAVRYLPIFPEVVPQTVESTAPAWLVMPSSPAFAPGASPTAGPPGARGGTH